MNDDILGLQNRPTADPCAVTASPSEPDHPALIHTVLSEPEEVEELPRTLDVVGMQVGDDL
ncbi:MAG: hypothetical protein M3Y49_09185 [Actinomycetota bacterium]|nr:hypothetical protein [Actinomycetota bacterium]